jgi:hypothetical protein
MKISFPKALALAVTALLSPLAAQGTEDLLTSVGTTVQSGGKTHAYLLWQPGEAAATLGKRFAIYAKPGDPDSPGTFTRLGIQTLQTSPNTIRALLELGTKIDSAAPAAAARIDGIHREITLQAVANPPLDSAEKLEFLIQSAVTAPRLLSRLFFLGRAHPGVMQVLGHAFSVPIPAGKRTFEIREIDLADADLRVVGRVTLDPAAPVILAAPASPVRVRHPIPPASQYTHSPKDHLNARLRWGVGPTLRAQLPHSFGFDLLRVQKEHAVSKGWHLSPPTSEAVLSALANWNPKDPNPVVAMANEMPILVGDLLTPAQAGDLNDLERFDFSDDGVWHEAPDGQKIRRPYTDGESFYYFAAARGITGAPGNFSSGSLVQMCDRLPPNPPSIFSVTSNFLNPDNPADWAAQGGSQFLQVKIRQLPPGVPGESASGYYLYRWSSAQEYLLHLGNPEKNRIGGVISHINGTFRTFNDNEAGSPTFESHPDKSVWYTVRAIGESACDGEKVLSGHSAPVAGVLRDFKAPDGPVGSFLVCRSLPTATFLDLVGGVPKDGGLPPDARGMTVQVLRDGPQVVATEIEVSVQQNNKSWLVLYSRQVSYQLTDTIRVDLPFTEPTSKDKPMRIRVRAIAANGLVSLPAETSFGGSGIGDYLTVRFDTKATKNCIDIREASVPVHESADIDGTVNVIQGSISFAADQGVREWRVYRRVGSDGPLSLIAKAEGGSIPNPGPWQDDALTSASGTSVCYYGQIFDQNANPSPLVLLGCTTMTHADLPTPMLAPAAITGTAGNSIQVKLEWFCDPAGVERFEILAAVDGGGVPEIQGLSPLLTETPIALADFPDLAFYPFQTSRLGTAIGNGPSFESQISLPAARRVVFVIRASGPGSHGNRAHGSASNIVSAQWQPEPEGPQPVIPWPARPLPGDYDQRLPIEAYGSGEGPLWPIILPTDFNVPTGILIGLTRHPLQSLGGGGMALASPSPPENYLHKIRNTPADAGNPSELMPFMLYRYQEPSSAFPQARANLVQCTPLIDRISWKYVKSDKGDSYQIYDPFLLIISHPDLNLALPFSGAWDDKESPALGFPNAPSPPPYLQGTTGSILLKDPLPVIIGAKYRHLIVQFEPRGEIKRIIPLQPVEHLPQ